MLTTGMCDRPLVVVLGASGYVGSAVAAELARWPVRLRLVARRPGVVPPGGAAETETRTADLTAAGEVALAVADADVVIHLVARLAQGAAWRAAESDPVAERVNVGVMHDVVAALRSGRRAGRPPVVVFAGSVYQVGRPGRVDGSEPDEPATAYARQKLDAERALKSATVEGVMRGISLRLPTVYGAGPGPRGNGVVQAMVLRALADEPLTVWKGSVVERDLVHVEDVAHAFVSCLAHEDALAGRHWLLGSGRPVTVPHLFGAIAAGVSARTGRPAVPVTAVDPPAMATAADFHGTVVDSSAFRAVTGWRPRLSLQEGLDHMVAAYV
ncbi:NAD-dependent epimerase/dehydratase family protein [Streptomyces avermitilis]|uniref:NAD-dependent epimerase/dehydratase family protein n=1 Tax=Streptomyces avermitilis TaxID=33903 RepID=UPI0033A6A596